MKRHCERNPNKGLSGILKYRFYMMKMLDCRSVDSHHVFLWFRNTEANFLEYFVFSQYNHKSLRWVLLTFLSNGKKCFPVDLPFGENPFKFADILRGKYLGAAAIKSINNENSFSKAPSFPQRKSWHKKTDWRCLIHQLLQIML